MAETMKVLSALFVILGFGLRSKAEGTSQNPDAVLALRQQLFDFALDVGVEVAQTHLSQLELPPFNDYVHVDWVGDVLLDIEDIHCDYVSIPRESIQLSIEGDRYHFQADQVELGFRFSWHWESWGMGGYGNATISLLGGYADGTFFVTGGLTAPPHIVPLTGTFDFRELQVELESVWTQWLYDWALYFFKPTIDASIRSNVEYVLRVMVPNELNTLLATVPASFEVKGLPFATDFGYSITTSNFVKLDGYNTIGLAPTLANNAPLSPPMRPRAQKALARLLHAGLLANNPDSTRLPDATRKMLMVGSPLLLQGEPLGALFPRKRAPRRVVEPAQHKAAEAGANSADAGALGLTCPYTSSPLEMELERMEAMPQMATLFVSDQAARCVLWALQYEGLLAGWLVDDAVEGITFSTNLLALLLPGIILDYPNKPVRFYTEVLAPPAVVFTPQGTVDVEVEYRMEVYVETNRDSGVQPSVDAPPLELAKVASLINRQSASAEVTWTATRVLASHAHHEVEWAAYPTATVLWDSTMDATLLAQGKALVLDELLAYYFELPMVPQIRLVGETLQVRGGWAGLSVDVELLSPIEWPFEGESTSTW